MDWSDLNSGGTLSLLPILGLSSSSSNAISISCSSSVIFYSFLAVLNLTAPKSAFGIGIVIVALMTFLLVLLLSTLSLTSTAECITFSRFGWCSLPKATFVLRFKGDIVSLVYYWFLSVAILDSIAESWSESKGSRPPPRFERVFPPRS